MPHIFPKRFLRTRDILDTHEMNEDTQPVQELLSGNLDRHNFDGKNLKLNLKPEPTSGFPSVADGAYYNIHTSSIESQYKFHRDKSGSGRIRKPPNFVKLDGVTLRDAPYTPIDNGNLKRECPPFVVPNTGEWAVVKNADLTGPQQLKFTTGQSKIWICAYVQYVWQGFYEWKPPYISETNNIGGSEDLKFPPDGKKWTDFGGPYRLHLLDVMNFFGPQKSWRVLPSKSTKNRESNLRTYDGDTEFAFALNEISPKNERFNPNLGGYHHLSQGFYPTLIQFALRVDGKIVDESITGKRLSFEESAHGLQAAESPNLNSDEPFTAGQRSGGTTSDFEDSKLGRSGQKLSYSRAVSCGPEVMPVRVGALVPVSPGEHTVELVVRRLSRKRLKFQAGDFVGVFSRRLVAFDLPQVAPRQEGKTESITVPNFEVEDVIRDENLSDSRKILADRANKIEESDVFSRSIPNTHLPSKVLSQATTSIEPPFEVELGSGFFGSKNNVAKPRARFPGFENGALLNNEVLSASDGWDTGGSFVEDTPGWFRLRSQDLLGVSKPLAIGTTSVSDTSDVSFLLPEGGLSIDPGEKLILFMDVELRGIEPLLRPEAEEIKKYFGSKLGTLQVGFYGSYFQAERYLDLFALFSIGYKVGDNWTIASESVPAVVNSFNWTNRGFGFCAVRNGSTSGSISPSIYAEDKFTKPGSILNSKGTAQTEIDGRGAHTLPNNLGINVPIFKVIEATNATGPINITEIAGFTCSEIPSYWTEGTKVGPTADADRNQWVVPEAEGRKILRGARVHYGNSRLSVIKIAK
tara:strand:- start:7514 stop:9928 length:2415 start_codon:yes stop_codon:yes gene_type:complete